jgi:hypothetical protein
MCCRQMFGGLIQKEGHSTYPAIRDTPYGKSDYFVLNFNDTVLSLGTLFVLLLVSNMHNIATGFTAVTEGASTKLFFISWYCIGTLHLLNHLMASLLTSLISFWFSRKNSGQTNPDDDNTVDETVAEQMAEGSETASVDSIPEGSNDYEIRATGVSLGEGDVGYIVKEDNIFSTVLRPSRLRDELGRQRCGYASLPPELIYWECASSIKLARRWRCCYRDEQRPLQTAVRRKPMMNVLRVGLDCTGKITCSQWLSMVLASDRAV